MGQEPIAERFVIRRRIGAGGMGVVYEAYDRARGQTVALKKLLDPDPSGLVRLKREFRSLADVAHPNLVPLYELIADGSEWFFTMELIEGVDFLRYVRASAFEGLFSTDSFGDEPTIEAGAEVLAAHVDQRPFAPLPEWTALRASMLQLAEGIMALHNAGKLHRDLKPSNVLVRPSGHLVILDFGLVEELHPLQKTRAVTFAGTPVYMSPEQIEQSPISTASDWYAAGVMLYEALTGILPFDGNVYSILMQQRSAALYPPREIVPDAPEDLSELCMDLLARVPEERPAGAEILARLAGSTPAPTPLSSRETVFVGRERELRELWRAYACTNAGAVATAIVGGRSGIGKSALIQRFLGEVEESGGEAIVLRGRCYQQESVPYKALDSLIDDLLHAIKRLDPDEMRAVVPTDVAMLARIFPVLEALETKEERDPSLDVADVREVRRRAIAALREIFARLAAKRPVVLFIDDVQWGDRDSAVVLAALLEPPGAPAIFTILAARSDEAGPRPFLDEIGWGAGVPPASVGHPARQSSAPGETPVAAARRPPRAFGDVFDIPIHDLTLDESRELAVLLGGPMPDHRLQSIARESSGSPMFVSEMVRFVAAMGGEQAPANLDDLIRIRVAAMPPAERHVLEMLAIAGQPLERNVLHATLGEEIGNAVLSLRSERMVRSRVIDGQESVDPSHDRFREAVLATMTEDDRRARHLRLAVVLEELGRDDPEMLTTHYAAAGEPIRAAQHAVVAAAHASAALAFDHAARLYRLALDLHPSIENANELRSQLADALTRAGRGFEAAPIYLSAAEDAEPNAGLELRRRAAENLLRGGHVDQGLSIMSHVLGSVGMQLPATPRRAFYGIIAQRIWLKLRGTKPRERATAEITPEDLLRVDVCWAVAVGLARIDNIRAAYFQVIHLRLALQSGDPYRMARALAVEAGYSSIAGGRARKRTEELVREADHHARELNHPHVLGLSALAQTFMNLFLGRFRPALQKANEAEKLFRERCTGVAWEIDTSQACAMAAMTYLGEIAQLAPRLQALLREAESRADRYGAWNLAGRPSICWLALDDTETAIRINTSVIDRWTSERFQSQHLFELLASSQIDLYLGRPVEAWQRITRCWPAIVHSKILRGQFAHIELLHVRARIGLAVASSTGDRSVLRQVERDAAKVTGMQMDWALPLAQCIGAGLRALEGDLDESRRLLETAVRNFEKEEMMLYAAAARRQLGKITGGDEGAALIGEADAFMRRQLVKIPDRIAEVLVPV